MSEVTHQTSRHEAHLTVRIEISPELREVLLALLAARAAQGA
jgi:hypothetical protein